MTERGQPIRDRRILIVGGTEPVATDLAQASIACGARVALATWPWARTGTSRGAVEDVVMLPRFATDEDGVFSLIDSADAEMGGVDTLVIDAIADGASSDDLDRVSTLEWESGLERDLWSPFAVIQGAVESFLVSRTPGRLLLVTAADVRGAPARAARTAIHSLSRSVARELGQRGITSNVLDIEQCGMAAEGWLPAALFLVGMESSFVTGEVVAPRALGDGAGLQSYSTKEEACVS